MRLLTICSQVHWHLWLRHNTNNGRAYFPDDRSQIRDIGGALELRRVHDFNVTYSYIANTNFASLSSVRPSPRKMILTIPAWPQCMFYHLSFVIYHLQKLVILPAICATLHCLSWVLPTPVPWTSPQTTHDSSNTRNFSATSNFHSSIERTKDKDDPWPYRACWEVYLFEEWWSGKHCCSTFYFSLFILSGCWLLL